MRRQGIKKHYDVFYESPPLRGYTGGEKKNIIMYVAWEYFSLNFFF